jgi:hypothetical protein
MTFSKGTTEAVDDDFGIETIGVIIDATAPCASDEREVNGAPLMILRGKDRINFP